jgi:hypothetical protein
MLKEETSWTKVIVNHLQNVYILPTSYTMACYKTWNWHNIYTNVYHILWHIIKHGIGTTCHGLIITAELWILNNYQLCSSIFLKSLLFDTSYSCTISLWNMLLIYALFNLFISRSDHYFTFWIVRPFKMFGIKLFKIFDFFKLRYLSQNCLRYPSQIVQDGRVMI